MTGRPHPSKAIIGVVFREMRLEHTGKCSLRQLGTRQPLELEERAVSLFWSDPSLHRRGAWGAEKFWELLGQTRGPCASTSALSTAPGFCEAALSNASSWNLISVHEFAWDGPFACIHLTPSAPYV